MFKQCVHLYNNMFVAAKVVNASYTNILSLLKFKTLLLSVLVLVTCVCFFHISFSLLYFNTCLFLFVFYLINNFLSLSKKIRLNNFTIFLDRFYKKVFLCFWSIEGFLFFIFIFVLLNINSESFYCLNKESSLSDNLSVFYTSIPNLYYICVVICLTNLLIIKGRRNLLLFIILVLFLMLFFYEATQFIFILNEFFNINNYINIKSLRVTYNLDLKKKKNIYMFFLIVQIVKFWHIFFLLLYFIMIINQKNIKAESLTFFTQNLIFFFILFFVSFIFLIKFYIKYTLMTFYMWFSV